MMLSHQMSNGSMTEGVEDLSMKSHNNSNDSFIKSESPQRLVVLNISLILLSSMAFSCCFLCHISPLCPSVTNLVRTTPQKQLVYSVNTKYKTKRLYIWHDKSKSG